MIGTLVYAAFDGERLAMTLALPHFRQRSLLTKLAIGAPGRSPKFVRSCSDIARLCRHVMHSTRMTPLCGR